MRAEGTFGDRRASGQSEWPVGGDDDKVAPWFDAFRGRTAPPVRERTSGEIVFDGVEKGAKRRRALTTYVTSHVLFRMLGTSSPWVIRGQLPMT